MQTKYWHRCLVIVAAMVMLAGTYTPAALAEYEDTDVYTVKSGDTLWLISIRYQIGLQELIAANPQFEDPDVIYPGDKVYVPLFSTVSRVEQEIVRLVNIERSKHGLKPLAHNWELARVARYKSMDMRDQGYFSHQSPTYGSPFEMMRDFGISFRMAGENIAAGQRTAESVVAAWMNSEGHRKNIMHTSFSQIGVGYVSGGAMQHYWTQLFIRP